MSLLVVRAVGIVTVQDRGRPGHMHEGLPAGGALVPAWLARANARLGNAHDAAAIEIMGALTVVAQRDTTIATDREGPRDLDAGGEVTLSSGDARVTCLALPGGVDAPVVLGSRSTHVSAGIGVLLHRGVSVEVQGRHPPPRSALWRAGKAGPCGPAGANDSADAHGPAPIAIVIGPDLDAFVPDALERLTSTDWIVSAASSRVGTRLEGQPIGRRDDVDQTRPMVCGAIEVPPDGQPIVLGPEHPTTGGYPVIAVIAHADLGRFFGTGIGKGIRFSGGGG